MQAELALWEAERAGYQRHIQILEQKLKDTMVEKEKLQEHLDAVISGGQPGTNGPPWPHHHHEMPVEAWLPWSLHRRHSAPVVATRAPSSTNTNEPAPVVTTTDTMADKAVFEAQVDSLKSGGETQPAEATVTAPPYCSAEQRHAREAAPKPAESECNDNVLDVSIINPQLDGMQLKAAAVRHPTFSTAQSSPPSLSSNSENTACAAEGQSPKTPPHHARQESDVATLKGSKAQSLHVLAPAECGRRGGMHVGQAPRPGTARFPGPVTDEVGQDGPAGGAARVRGRGEQEQEQEQEHEHEQQQHKTLRRHGRVQSCGTLDVFMDDFTKKLENISSGAEDGIPTVLKGGRKPTVVVCGGGAFWADKGQDETLGEPKDGRDDDGATLEADEADVALRLKASTNFGLPWGQFRRIRKLSCTSNPG